MRIRVLPVEWMYCGLALVLFASAMVLPVAGHDCSGWRLVYGLVSMGVIISPDLFAGGLHAGLLGGLLLLVSLAGLGNAVFFLAPLALWWRGSPRAYRWLLCFAGLGLLLMSGIAFGLLVMAKIRIAYVLWLLAYIPLMKCLRQQARVVTAAGGVVQALPAREDS